MSKIYIVDCLVQAENEEQIKRMLNLKNVEVKKIVSIDDVIQDIVGIV